MRQTRLHFSKYIKPVKLDAVSIESLIYLDVLDGELLEAVGEDVTELIDNEGPNKIDGCATCRSKVKI